MKRILRLVGALALTAGVVITPLAARNANARPALKHISIGVVLDVGGVNDKSFNHLAYVGLQRAETLYGATGGYIATQEQAQYVPNLTHYAQLHPSLVIAVGGLMSQAIYTVAQQFPHQKFAIIDGTPADANFKEHNLPNVANLHFPEQQSGFLAGVLAGLMEKNRVGKATHNVIGAMGGLPVPAVIRYIAGYKAGAKRVDSSVKVLIGYSQSFTDQGKGNSIGRTQISQGADILFGVAGGSGLGYLRAAQQAGRYAVGVDADQSYLGRYILTSAIKRVDKSVLDIVHEVVQGHFRAGTHVYNIKRGDTGIGKTSPAVPAAIVHQVKDYAKLMKRGKITPPAAIPGG